MLYQLSHVRVAPLGCDQNCSRSCRPRKLRSPPDVTSSFRHVPLKRALRTRVPRSDAASRPGPPAHPMRPDQPFRRSSGRYGSVGAAGMRPRRNPARSAARGYRPSFDAGRKIPGLASNMTVPAEPLPCDADIAAAAALIADSTAGRDPAGAGTRPPAGGRGTGPSGRGGRGARQLPPGQTARGRPDHRHQAGTAERPADSGARLIRSAEPRMDVDREVAAQLAAVNDYVAPADLPDCRRSPPRLPVSKSAAERIVTTRNPGASRGSGPGLPGPAGMLCYALRSRSFNSVSMSIWRLSRPAGTI
jgi:hypothetical protein